MAFEQRSQGGKEEALQIFGIAWSRLRKCKSPEARECLPFIGNNRRAKRSSRDSRHRHVIDQGQGLKSPVGHFKDFAHCLSELTGGAGGFRQRSDVTDLY